MVRHTFSGDKPVVRYIFSGDKPIVQYILCGDKQRQRVEQILYGDNQICMLIDQWLG